MTGTGAAGLVVGAVGATTGITLLVAGAARGLTRRPARGPAHTVWAPMRRGRIGAPCRCLIGRDHWQDGAFAPGGRT